MLRIRVHRRALAWVMLMTLILATLTPGLARALAAMHVDSRPWSVVCSTAGAPRDSAPAGRSDVQSLLHCSYCALQADTLAPPPSTVPSLPAPALSFAVPPLFLRAPQRLHAWSTAQARAPPLQA